MVNKIRTLNNKCKWRAEFHKLFSSAIITKEAQFFSSTPMEIKISDRIQTFYTNSLWDEKYYPKPIFRHLNFWRNYDKF